MFHWCSSAKPRVQAALRDALSTATDTILERLEELFGTFFTALVSAQESQEESEAMPATPDAYR